MDKDVGYLKDLAYIISNWIPLLSILVIPYFRIARFVF